VCRSRQEAPGKVAHASAVASMLRKAWYGSARAAGSVRVSSGIRHRQVARAVAGRRPYRRNSGSRGMAPVRKVGRATVRQMRQESLVFHQNVKVWGRQSGRGMSQAPHAQENHEAQPGVSVVEMKPGTRGVESCGCGVRAL